jgi:hypothetical protein
MNEINAQSETKARCLPDLDPTRSRRQALLLLHRVLANSGDLAGLTHDATLNFEKKTH